MIRAIFMGLLWIVALALAGLGLAVAFIACVPALVLAWVGDEIAWLQHPSQRRT